MTTTLFLPKRYENLRDAAEEQQADLTRVVRRVPDATARIEQLLRQITSGQMGRFELFHGESGSGKTTFLSTLPRFYDGIHVTPIADNIPLLAIPEDIRKREVTPQANQVYVLLDRDNPVISAGEMRTFFESMRRLFRTREGRILVVWPITDTATASSLSMAAWEVGADSLVDASSKGLYRFTGLPKEDYYEVADITTRSLNKGQSLEAFGLGQEVTKNLLKESETISQFFGRLEAKSQEINNRIGDTLKDRRIPSVWILIGGDDTRELSLTVANLTQGTEKRIDIDRLVAVLDTPGSNTMYLEDWRRRRHEVAVLLRRLDVRLFELPPNVTVAAVRAFADPPTKERLKKKSDVPANASRAVQSARFFQLLAGKPSSAAATIRPADSNTANEYKRIQGVASTNDKPLNKALAAAIDRALQDVGISATVTAEQRKLDPHSNLQPDILVELVDGRLICLEPTWRTTGTEIQGELPEQQSSMTVGHIQQYLLAKVLEYVKDLGL
jgi:hypothetical protein